MTPFDVSLRLNLERNGFREGTRDLEELRRAADRMSGSRGGEELNRDLAKASRSADTARRDVEDISRAVDRLGGNQGADRLGRNFTEQVVKINAVERAVRDVGRAVETVDGQKLDRLQREMGDTTRRAQEMERGFRNVGRTTPALEGAGGAAGFLARSATSAFAAIGAFASVDQIVAGLSRIESGFRDVDRAAAKTAVTAERNDLATQRALIDENKTLGRTYGTAQAGVAEARHVFAEGGVSLQEQSAILPPTLRAAIGSGASPQTIARGGRALMQNMGVSQADLPAAYDIMAKGGKLGAFELEAQAKNFPEIAAQLSQLGVTGLGGTADGTAMLQIVRRNAGSEDEAANNLTNFLSSITSPETVSNFKDKRSSLPRIIQQAQQNGQNPVWAVLDETERLTKGDPFKMGQLFGDQQAMNAVRALLQNRGDLQQMTQTLRTDSKGTSDRDYEYMQTTASGREDRQRAEREAASIEIGESLNPFFRVFSSTLTKVWEREAKIAQGFNESGILEGAKRFLGSRSPAMQIWEATKFGLTPPDEEEIDGRKAEAEHLADEIARDRAAIASSGRSQNWMAESRLAVKQRRYDELVGTLRTDLGVAETERGSGSGTAELESRIQSLTQALRDLEKKLEGASVSGGASPISFRAEASGEPRLWNASHGRGGGGFASAYSGDRPVMDGTANMPRRAAAGMSGQPLGRGPGALSSHPDLSPQAFLNGDVANFPAGMRNNNPGNLKFTGSAWQRANYPGIVGPSVNKDEGDPQIVFNNPQAGLESMARLALTKFDNGRDTVQGMISAPGGWTPGKKFASNTVAASLGIKPDAKINLRDPQQMQRFMRALITQEHGPKGAAYTDDMILGAVDSALNGRAVAGSGEGLAPVTYTNAGATRNRPITPELMENIQRGIAAVYGEGYRGEIYSGGQPAAGSGGRRTGSTRHDDNGHGGRAADLYVYGPDGRKVRGEELAKLGQHWAATGQGGVGMEMRGGGIHLDEHKSRARSWDYRKDGGSFTPGQAERMRQGLAGIAPDYANASALDPAAVAAKTGELPPRLPKPTTAHRPSASPDEGPMPTTAGLGRGGRGQTIQITQNIHGAGDPRIAAARSQREQHRAIRLADSGAMHDTMVPIA